MQLSSKRGRTHNAEGAREAILNAAEQVFAEHGFDGTRVDTVAEVAGYNKSLIFQYFVDKVTLYASVIRRADQQMNQFQNQTLMDALNDHPVNDIQQLKALLRAILNAYYDYLVAHPNFVRILNWELAEGWHTYAQITTEHDRQDMSAITVAMEKIAQSGWLRSKTNATSQLILGLFTSHLYLGLMPLFRVYLPQDDSQSEDQLAQARIFIIEFVIHGLVADTGETKT